MPPTKGLSRQKWLRDHTYIHVNQEKIRDCNKLRLQATKGERAMADAIAQMPDAITVKHNGTNTYGSIIIMRHPETGEEVARFVHDPANPYSCGAQIVCITKMDVEIISRQPAVLEVGCEVATD